MRRILVLCVLGVLSACASSEIKVRCDAHLQPINPPVAAVKDAGRAGSTSTAPVDPPPARNPP